jgi:hypothetical protein
MVMPTVDDKMPPFYTNYKYSSTLLNSIPSSSNKYISQILTNKSYALIDFPF